MVEAPTAARPAIRAERLGKRFGRLWALSHLDLEVEPGETLLLAGANGSGKTTLLRLIAGLHRPTRGSISVFGHDTVGERLASRRQLAVVSHHSYLYDRLTALETVRIWTRLLGLRADGSELLERLREVGLAERADVPVGGFSAGMRKRLSLLQTRLKAPRLVLFDEPFSALDRQGQRLVEDWIEQFHSAGVTVVLASHDLDRAAAICDRAVLLRAGQQIWSGVAHEVVDKL
jgi:heme exporter protein A